MQTETQTQYKYSYFCFGCSLTGRADEILIREFIFYFSPMAAAGLVRAFRKKGAMGIGHQQENDVDTEPAYLKYFPKPSNVVKDIHLGVLLGRQVNEPISSLSSLC
jgi:hypothetical protein